LKSLQEALVNYPLERAAIGQRIQRGPVEETDVWDFRDPAWVSQGIEKMG
jgi:hypothetical protein